MNLEDLFDLEDLAAAIDTGYVTRKPHPTLALNIYTYTERCQYDNVWRPVTIRCRGLIADHTGRIVALPFPKIFASSMHGVFDFAPALPDELFEIYEKVDGSLIIVFHYAGRWHAASKGSFTSGQAQWAQALLDRSRLDDLDTELTYLAEAIYPSNRIVVDYGPREDLVLLGAYQTNDGYEPPLQDVALDWAQIGSVVRSYGFNDALNEVETLASLNIPIDGGTHNGIDAEGWIVRYPNGQRAKIKLAAYLTLHKLFTGTNERTVWEALAAGQDLADLFAIVPDEFRDWVNQVATQLRAEHNALAMAAHREYAAIMDALPDVTDRKAFALAAAASPHRPAMFLFYDGRHEAVSAWAWKQLKPEAVKAFKTDEDQA